MKNFYKTLSFLSFIYAVGIAGSCELSKIKPDGAMIIVAILLALTFTFKFLAKKTPQSAATEEGQR